MNRRSRSLLFAAVAAASFALAGCVDQSPQGSGTVYTFAWWALALQVVGGLAMIGVGVWQFRSSVWRSVIIIVAGVVIIAFIFPGMLRDRVVVDDDHFERVHGWLGESTTEGMQFAELKSITLVVETKQGGGGPTKVYSRLWEKKAGGREQIAMGDLLKAARPQIVEKAQRKGVQLIGFDAE